MSKIWVLAFSKFLSPFWQFSSFMSIFTKFEISENKMAEICPMTTYFSTYDQNFIFTLYRSLKTLTWKWKVLKICPCCVLLSWLKNIKNPLFGIFEVICLHFGIFQVLCQFWRNLRFLPKKLWKYALWQLNFQYLIKIWSLLSRQI